MKFQINKNEIEKSKLLVTALISFLLFAVVDTLSGVVVESGTSVVGANEEEVTTVVVVDTLKSGLVKLSGLVTLKSSVIPDGVVVGSGTSVVGAIVVELSAVVVVSNGVVG